MPKPCRLLFLSSLSLLLCGCGLGVSRLPEVWDRDDPQATAHMEIQIKRAVFCELRAGAILTRVENGSSYSYKGKSVTSNEDIPLPDSWGAQVTLTLTADEKSTLSPGVSLKTPLYPGTVFNSPSAQSFALGLGGIASSQNVHYDKFDFYYTAADLINHAGPDDICASPPSSLLGPPSNSTPFIDARNLGIRDWLPGAIAVADFQRSSRLAANGEGAPLGSAGSFASDAVTFDNKFVIVTDGNITPTWNLVRVSTATTPLLDLNRTRTHELLITVGPGAVAKSKNNKTGRIVLRSVGPSAAALNTHFASQIGSAVAAALQVQ